MDWRARSARIQGVDRACYWAAGCALLLALAVALLWVFNRYAPNRPVTFDDPLDEFKYGSVGTDMENGMPLLVVRVLPRVFPEYLPNDASPRDYRAFGLIQENGHAMPIGFSERRRFLDLTGPNCAVCHVGRVITPGHPEGQIIPGMPGNSVDLQTFFRFLFRCAADWRFNPEVLIPAIEAMLGRDLDPVETTLHRLAIPLFKGGLLGRQVRLARYFGEGSSHPRWGPGRVDTFDTFKFDHFAAYYQGIEIPEEELYGTVALPSIWAQARREGLWLHWDGNNDSVRERNFSAAMAAGASREDMDSEIKRLFALQDWLGESLQPPAYPFTIDRVLADQGKAVFGKYCHICHGFNGARVGRVTPIDEIATDRGRLDSYTAHFAEIQRDYTKDRSWAFERFRKTNGYSNLPLDGIWARAPYLHNGSVPTLADLLQPAEQRPRSFFVGDLTYDSNRVGFRHDSAEAPDGRRLMLLNTAERGNGNQGHSGPPYGTELSDAEREALLEYLKTL